MTLQDYPELIEAAEELERLKIGFKKIRTLDPFQIFLRKSNKLSRSHDYYKYN